MAFELITVAIFGHSESSIAESIRLTHPGENEADNFDVHSFATDDDVFGILAKVRPHVIFTFGSIDSFPRLLSTPLAFRRRWVHYDDPATEPAELAQSACNVFMDLATHDRFPEEPLVSVFTPTYRSGERIMRAYRSLAAQSYSNWEWVLYDDSPEDDTFVALTALAKTDPRLHVFRASEPCGIIGEVKRRACGLARGSILVELDHDDELTPACLALVVDAFRRFPDAGFAYTDCCEIFEDGENGMYGDGYAFGFGSYRWETYRDHNYAVTNYPSINAKTVRHIVGMPNHVRAWTKEAYLRAGGYSPEVHVADDYELCIRTFLTTRIVHIKKFGYIQYLGRDESNTQRARNKEIQRLVMMFQRRYNAQIHDRFVELEVDDFIWKDGVLDWSTQNPVPAPIANYIYQ